MSIQTEYVERFMMHARLYMVSTGKRAREFTLSDMDQISRHIEMQSDYETGDHKLQDAKDSVFSAVIGPKADW